MSDKIYSGHKKWVLFPGRWQPLHEGHLAIMRPSLDAGKNICIGIRDTPVSSTDPYSAAQRVEMVRRAFGDLYGDRVSILVIPDLEAIHYGRGVGYEVKEITVTPEVASISATGVRAGRDTRVNNRVANYVGLMESTLWLTGLPCSGKTTIADKLIPELVNRGYDAVPLDGDDVRLGINKGLGFSEEDRRENLRRIGEVSKLFNDRKKLVVASFVSPTEELRGIVKGIIAPKYMGEKGKPNRENRFKLVYVDCPVEVCEQRDVKGMYAKARKGEIKDFTGVSAPFEAPTNPTIVVHTDKEDLETCVAKILRELDA